MSKSSLKRQSEGLDPQLETSHWSSLVQDCTVCISPEGTLNLAVGGGSDRGEFAYFENLVQNRISYLSGRLENGDVILEVQGQKVAGFTNKDVVAWLNHCCKSGQPVRISVAKGGYLGKDLRLHLNTRFPKNSPDCELQNTVRDNLYLRTVPCTTRHPRDGEINGVDYTFLTVEEFIILERSGKLLESGIYEGNHYGTPKPQEENPAPVQRINSNINAIPGLHPSSEGKRRRNRSSVEAMTAKTDETTYNGHSNKNASQSSVSQQGSVKSESKEIEDEDDLGPLPENWEKAFTEEGEPYFIDHNTGTSQWLDPRPKYKKAVSECGENELPYGWEKINDPHYGTYYIDHINKRTQYENPVAQARNTAGSVADSHESNVKQEWKTEPTNGQQTQDIGPPYSGLRGSGYQPPYRFTENPAELEGVMASCRLVKGPRGLGFTIVGGDDQDSPREFLQIKAVVPGGPAWHDGTLQTGDVLVHINDQCVLGSSHQEAVSLFQAIPPGGEVRLGICKGYRLPFDPDDPNTHIVTTSAIDLPNGSSNESTRSAKSMPDLTSVTQRNFVNDPCVGSEHSQSSHNVNQKPEFLSVEIIKGNGGFGFTIADSVYGQKVKKILDRDRCLGLQEGDVLVEINGRSVEGVPHAHVVQILKECPIDRPARIALHRHPNRPPTRMKSADDIGVRRSASNNSSHSYHNRTTDSYNVNTMYRSKTPTAELYSSREKEVVSRPKTPLVDTRHWPEQPRVNGMLPTRSDSGRLQPNIDSSRHSVGGDSINHRPTGYSNGWRNDHPPALRTAYSAALDKTTVNPSWYTTLGKLRDTYWAPETHKELNKSVDFGTMNHAPEAYYPHAKGPPPVPTRNTFNDSYEDSVFSHDSYRNSVPGEWNAPLDPHYAVNDMQYQRTVSAHSNGPYSHPIPYGNGPTSHADYRSASLGHSPSGGSGSHYDSLSRRKEGLYSTGSIYSQGSQAPEYIDMTVTLHRQESGFGFRIVGGTEEGSQVAIGHIVPGGSADLDSRIQTGDEIVTVEGQSVLRTSHCHVVQLIGSAAHGGRLTLGLRRRISTADSAYGLHSSESMYPYDVTVHRQENEGFGFVIISSVNRSGATIGRIIEGSPAERCGQLHVGDSILAVNGVSILNLHHGETVNLIKNSGLAITLTVGPPDVPPAVDKNSIASSQGCEEGEYHAVELVRGAKGFGFSIRGGKEFHNMPLFVLRIAPDGPAHQHGKLMVGDQIIEINAKNTKNMTHAEAIELIRQGNNTVRLLIRRGGGSHCPTDEDISLNRFPQHAPQLAANCPPPEAWNPYDHR